jgi:predicted YcjX-like family ATPase
MGIVSDYQKIGIVGIYNSGKTVFLTSLINHLLHHDAFDFRIYPSELDRKLSRLPVLGGLFNPGVVRVQKPRVGRLREGENGFEYERYRDELMRNGVWPEKTCADSHYRIQCQLSSQFVREMDLHFYDFPGERIADAAMGVLDYGEWSDHVLGRIMSDGDYRDLAKEFLEIQGQDRPIEAETILGVYKIGLARFRRSFRPFVTPSSFILDVEGRMINSRLEPEGMVVGRLCGVGEGAEFVPLGEDARKRNPELAERFSGFYERYKKELVLPSLNHLRTCDRLIVLVDIPTLLNSGYLMANDVHDLTRDLLDFCRPGKNFIEKMYALTGVPFLLRRVRMEALSNTKITRIAFVASKCDLVHEEDRDHLLVLLKELVDNLPEKHDGVDYDFFCCSAVQSTVSDTRSHGLLGVPDLPGTDVSEGERLVTVSRVPSHWPDRWEPGDFCFPEFRPMKFPGLKTRPPKQLGLDKVFSYVLGSKITD